MEVPRRAGFTPVESHVSPLFPDRLSQAVASLGSKTGLLYLVLLLSHLLHHFLLKGLDLHLQPLLWPSPPRRRRTGWRRACLVHPVTHTKGVEVKKDGHFWIDFSSLTLACPPPCPPSLAHFPVILAFSRWLTISVSSSLCVPPFLPLFLATSHPLPSPFAFVFLLRSLWCLSPLFCLLIIPFIHISFFLSTFFNDFPQAAFITSLNSSLVCWQMTTKCSVNNSSSYFVQSPLFSRKPQAKLLGAFHPEQEAFQEEKAVHVVLTAQSNDSQLNDDTVCTYKWQGWDFTDLNGEQINTLSIHIQISVCFNTLLD